MSVIEGAGSASSTAGVTEELITTLNNAPSNLTAALAAIAEFKDAVAKINEAVEKIEDEKTQALEAIEQKHNAVNVLLVIETLKAVAQINTARNAAILGGEDEAVPGIHPARDAALADIGDKQETAVNVVGINREIAVKVIQRAKAEAIDGTDDVPGINQARDAAVRMIEDAGKRIGQQVGNLVAQAANFANQLQAAMQYLGSRFDLW
jgi:hypothetical protein